MNNINLKKQEFSLSHYLQGNIARKDFLYHDLPCVWDGNSYIVFSPYTLKIARINPNMIYKNSTRHYLETQNFFGSPTGPKQFDTTADICLILSTDCNLRCKYCYVVYDTKVHTMSPDYAIRVIREKVTSKTKKVSLSFFGGEATLNMAALRASVEYTKSLGLPYRFIINTNGTASDEDLDFMISNGFIFSISSDGPPELTDFLRPAINGSGISRIIERTIRRLVDANALFQIRSTVTNENHTCLVDGIKYWNDLGVSFVHIEPIGASKIYNNFITRPNSVDYISSIINVVNEAERYGTWIISSPYMNLMTPSTYFCISFSGEKELYTPDGAISACYRLQEKDYIPSDFLLGYYDENKNTFIRYDYHTKQRKSIELDLNSYCVKCHCKYICAGGCPIGNKTLTGDIQGIDRWSCFVKKSLIHDAIIRINRGLEKGITPIIFGQSLFEQLADDKFFSN